MANRDDDQTPANGGPLLIGGPKAEADSPIIDLEPLKATAEDRASAEEEDKPADDAPSGLHLPRYAPLAAAVVFAVVLGALAGAATTAGLMRDSLPPPSIAAADATRDLQKTVAQLSSELATLKSGIASAQRSTTSQFGKLADRLDRTEKAQAEPAAKLAKIQESVERLDKRQQQAMASADVTGSVTPKPGALTPKDQAHPPIAEGWRLRDYYAGRAVLESRNGTLYEVGPGANVPGLGKIESIKRENGKVVVLAKGGIVTAAIDPRRPPYGPSYRY
jgi:hypothetical protein